MANIFTDQPREPRILIQGTSFIHGAAAQETFRMWADLILRLNPGTDVLVIDSASPMELPYYAPPLKYKILEDNIGHLARGGRDGWGRAFTAGVRYAIDRGYEWLANIECDILFAKPIEPIFARMVRSGVKCCAPMASPFQFSETGLSFWSVDYLRRENIMERYDWEHPPANGLLPEQRIDAICDEDMWILPARGFRNDQRWSAEQMMAAFPHGIDWVTHCELPVSRRFLEMNNLLGEVEHV